MDMRKKEDREDVKSEINRLEQTGVIGNDDNLKPIILQLLEIADENEKLKEQITNLGEIVPEDIVNEINRFKIIVLTEKFSVRYKAQKQLLTLIAPLISKQKELEEQIAFYKREQSNVLTNN